MNRLKAYFHKRKLDKARKTAKHYRSLARERRMAEKVNNPEMPWGDPLHYLNEQEFAKYVKAQTVVVTEAMQFGSPAPEGLNPRDGASSSAMDDPVPMVHIVPASHNPNITGESQNLVGPEEDEDEERWESEGGKRT